MARFPPFEDALTHSVIGAFFEVYNTLGFGFLEHLYVGAMERELLERGHRVARQVGISVMFKGHNLGTQRLDMIVDERLVVETKSTYELHRAATRQVYNYLRASRLTEPVTAPRYPTHILYIRVCRNGAEPIYPRARTSQFRCGVNVK